jgi:hypothetical protein
LADSVEMRLSEMGRCTARTLDAAPKLRLARARKRCCEASSGHTAIARGRGKLGDGKVVLTGGSHRWRSGRGTRWEQSKMR